MLSVRAVAKKKGSSKKPSAVVPATAPAAKKGDVRRRPSAQAGEVKALEPARQAAMTAIKKKKKKMKKKVQGVTRATEASKAATRGPAVLVDEVTSGSALEESALDKLLWDIADEVGAAAAPGSKSRDASEKKKLQKVKELRERYAEYRSAGGEVQGVVKKGGMAAKEEGGSRRNFAERLAQKAGEAAKRHVKKRRKRDRRRSNSGSSEDSARGRRRGGNRRRCSSSSSRSSSRSKSPGDGKDLVDKARRRPGGLLKAGLKLMAGFLGGSWGAGQAGEGTERLEDVRRLVSTYLTTALHPSLGHTLPRRMERELRTVAEVLDCILNGRIPEAGDILMQRFRALETAATDGTWELAKHMELIPDTRVSSVPMGMRREALQRENLLRKLHGGGRRWERSNYDAHWPTNRLPHQASNSEPSEGAKHVTFDLTEGERKSALKVNPGETLGGKSKGGKGQGKGWKGKGKRWH